MQEMFEGANFGDRYVTNDGEIVIFHYKDPDYNLFYLIAESGGDLICDFTGANIYSDDSFIISKAMEDFQAAEVIEAAEDAFDDYTEDGEECDEEGFTWGFQAGVDWILEKLGMVCGNDSPKED